MSDQTVTWSSGTKCKEKCNEIKIYKIHKKSFSHYTLYYGKNKKYKQAQTIKLYCYLTHMVTAAAKKKEKTKKS